MELHLILDGGVGTLNDEMWLENSSSPPYDEDHDLQSPNHESIAGTITVQQTGLQRSNGYNSPAMINWEDKTESPNYSPVPSEQTVSAAVTAAGVATSSSSSSSSSSSASSSSPTADPTAGSGLIIIRSSSSSPREFHQQSGPLQQQQRHVNNDNNVSSHPNSNNNNNNRNHHHHHHQRQQIVLQENSLKRRSVDNIQQIGEHIEHKLVKKDTSLSNDSRQGWSTQVEDLAEHLAADFDGSLSVLAASDLATAVASYNMGEALLGLPSLTVFKQEAPSPENHHNNPSLNHVSQRGINIQTGNGPSVVGVMEADSNNNNNNGHNGTGQTANSLHQLLYSNDNEYSATSGVGNQVSSSQQGIECNEDCRFQYVLAAATSIATKINEETLTYLNQGQSYEIKLKKLGDLSGYRGKILKSSIRICFHERRLQYTEREQMLAWQRTRPGERLLEVDVPLSYGIVDIRQPSPSSNVVEFMWDPTKEVGVYIKVNCISTEFTPKKHGGEKGVPFRIQVETRVAGGTRLHAASCQVKVFKLKGADRKHKQDRDKVFRRPPHEQDKYQPSYDCTVLSDIPLDCLTSPSPDPQNDGSPFAPSDAATPQSRAAMGGSSSPVAGPIPMSVNSSGVLPLVSGNPETAKESTSPASSVSSPATILPEQSCVEMNTTTSPTSLSPEANASQTSSWLRAGRFHSFESTFASFSASDILRLSRDDLIQICGLADGIRLFNALHSKPPSPRLTLYLSAEGSGALWRAVYLDTLTSSALAVKVHTALGAHGPPQDRLHSVVILGPQGIHVLVTDDLVANMKDESMYVVETVKDANSDRYKILLKPSSR
ncbi:transcription factor CP2 isoform X2 [Neodiprion fabricii]|uniref:transcription factor CP2 isoform X2 n=1 Tax=Neodiprion fabricii TaxID=2872261 RepID=UPI001ED904F0|nr:transcription factor CP2 isoform X2 [Neodiprion fabricii]